MVAGPELERNHFRLRQQTDVPTDGLSIANCIWRLGTMGMFSEENVAFARKYGECE